MAAAFSLMSGVAGGIAGWAVLRLVDWKTARKANRLEAIITVAASAVILAVLAMKARQPGPKWFVDSALIPVLIGVTLFDIRKKLIPHVVTIPGTIAGLIAGSYILPAGLRESGLGLIVGGGVLLVSTLIEKFRKKEIGGGDWKYAAMIGSFIGPQRVVVALVLTGVFGAIGAIALALSGHQGRPQALGPWLSAGAVASILLG
jgi:leader peptidase (prepilin peptidase)/N-methyltransferase